jgi:two-component system, NtrC family, nitrogen regulation sensor histidine kinase NtrY
MAYKYSWQSWFVTITSTFVCLVFGGALVRPGFFIYGIFLLCIGVICLIRIWYLFNQTNRSIAFFFDAIRNNDSTASFPITGKLKSADFLHRSLNLLNRHFQEVKLESELKEKYFRSIIRQSNTGFVILNCENDIELINEAACNFAGISVLSSNPNFIRKKQPALYDVLCNMKTGEDITYCTHNKFTGFQLLIKATEIKTTEKEIKLITLQDISHELTDKEVESYQKLISILTHEIMNSLAPLTSLSKTLSRVFIHNARTIAPDEVTEIHIQTTVQGLTAIESQAAGLMDFVGNYRKLIKIPNPIMYEIAVKDWMEQLRIIYQDELEAKGIIFEISIHEVSKVVGDKNLLNQVLINVINNARDSLMNIEYEKRIKIVVFRVNETIFIQVGNNGPVIPPEIQDKIFTPFFTTKENGSGIGLSVSQQIMHMHKGSLNVYSDMERGTIFTLKL